MCGETAAPISEWEDILKMAVELNKQEVIGELQKQQHSIWKREAASQQRIESSNANYH